MKKLYLAIQNQCKHSELKVFVADTFWTRLKGLLGTTSLPKGQGLLLCDCNSVHMIGMRYALDIIYLDKAGVILKIVENLKPWQVSCCWKAKDTLEVASGTAQCSGWQVGMKLKWHK